MGEGGSVSGTNSAAWSPRVAHTTYPRPPARSLTHSVPSLSPSFPFIPSLTLGSSFPPLHSVPRFTRPLGSLSLARSLRYRSFLTPALHSLSRYARSLPQAPHHGPTRATHTPLTHPSLALAPGCSLPIAHCIPSASSGDKHP